MWINHYLRIHQHICSSIGLFPLFCYHEQCCYRHSYTIFVLQYAFNFLGIYLGVELLCHLVTLCLTFWETVCFLPQVHHITFLPAMHEVSNLSTSSQIIVIIGFILLLFCHPNGCEVGILPCFWFVFPLWLRIVNIFSCPYLLSYIFLTEMSIGNCSMRGKWSPVPTWKSQWVQGSAGRTHAHGQILPWGIRPALYLGCYETCFC